MNKPLNNFIKGWQFTFFVALLWWDSLTYPDDAYLIFSKLFWDLV